MKLKKAIKLAKKHKTKISSNTLRMYQQTAKTLLHWIINSNSPTEELQRYMNATDWQHQELNYHVRYVTRCEPKLKSFDSSEERFKFLLKFEEKYGSYDDGEDNFIEMVFDGEINYSSI